MKNPVGAMCTTLGQGQVYYRCWVINFLNGLSLECQAAFLRIYWLWKSSIYLLSIRKNYWGVNSQFGLDGSSPIILGFKNDIKVQGIQNTLLQQLVKVIK